MGGRLGGLAVTVADRLNFGSSSQRIFVASGRQGNGGAIWITPSRERTQAVQVGQGDAYLQRIVPLDMGGVVCSLAPSNYFLAASFGVDTGRRHWRSTCWATWHSLCRHGQRARG